MALKLISKSSHLRFESDPDNGYAFDVQTLHDPETGWSASIVLGSHGHTTDEVAIERALDAAAHLLRTAGRGAT